MNTWAYPVLQLLAKAQTRQYRFVATVILTWEMGISSYRKTSQQPIWSMLPLFDRVSLVYWKLPTALSSLYLLLSASVEACHCKAITKASSWMKASANATDFLLDYNYKVD